MNEKFLYVIYFERIIKRILSQIQKFQQHQNFFVYLNSSCKILKEKIQFESVAREK